jgi:hypothetical protein
VRPSPPANRPDYREPPEDPEPDEPLPDIPEPPDEPPDALGVQSAEADADVPGGQSRVLSVPRERLPVPVVPLVLDPPVVLPPVLKPVLPPALPPVLSPELPPLLPPEPEPEPPEDPPLCASAVPAASIAAKVNAISLYIGYSQRNVEPMQRNAITAVPLTLPTELPRWGYARAFARWLNATTAKPCPRMLR